MSEQCVICLSEITDDALQTTCHHTFHAACLAPWKRETNACPTCRSALSADEPVRGVAVPADTSGDARLAMRLAQDSDDDADEEDDAPAVAQCLGCLSMIRPRRPVLHCTHCNEFNYCSPLCRALDFARHMMGECVAHARCPSCMRWIPRAMLLACEQHCERAVCRQRHLRGHGEAPRAAAAARKRQRTEGL